VRVGLASLVTALAALAAFAPAAGATNECHGIQACIRVAGADGAEMTVVESCQLALSKPLDDGHHRGVDEAQAQVAVALQQIAHPRIVRAHEFDDRDRLVLHICEERRKGHWTEPVAGEPVELDDDGSRNKQRLVRVRQELCAGLMVGVGAVHCGVERTGVADQRHERGS